MILTIGSIATGYGGLDAAVAAVFGAEVAWVADNDPDVGKILAERFPGVPNLGDVEEVDWEAVPRVDIVTAGFPLAVPGRERGRAPGRDAAW